MSQINGILRFDGSQPGKESIRPMLVAGEAACPDGAEIWCRGGVALGLGLLRTLPEARTANGPVHDPESGLTIVADARIDNRAELHEKLGIDEGGKLSDTALILDAYRKWQDRCVEHLIGDFAFAVWDERERKLFCARDVFGVNPFHYFAAPGAFFFASDISSLFALEEIPRSLDEGGMADVLAGLYLEEGKTLYQGISVLPPAHCMTVKEGAILLRKYWKPEGGEPIRFARDEDYVEAYRELFGQAVACRLESDGKVSGLLSGGLDSSSIAAMAGRMLAEKGRELTTYSFVLSEEQRSDEQDERQLIELMHELRGIDGRFITTRDFPGSVADLHENLDQNSPSGNSPYLAVLFRRMGEDGSRVLLDGYGGDHCPTCEAAIPLQEFLEGFQFIRLKDYLSAASPFYARSRLRILLHMLRKHFPKNSMAAIDEQVFDRSVMSRELQEQVGIRERAKRNIRFRPGQFGSLGEVMAHRLLQVGRGLDASPMFSGNRVERRYPLLDKRLVEFCLSIPSEQHNYDMNRRLMRRAMAGRLPDPIRLRHNKGIANMPGMPCYLRENRGHFIAAIDSARNDARIAAFIDIEKLRLRFSQALPTSYLAFMPGPTMRAFYLLLFLQRLQKNKNIQATSDALAPPLGKVND